MHAGALGASLSKKEMQEKGGGAELLRDGVCLSLEQLEEVDEKAEAVLSLKQLFSGVLTGLRANEMSASFPRCVRKRICAVVARCLCANMRMVVVSSSMISGGFYHSSGDYNKTLNIVRASSMKERVKYEQKAQAES